MEKQYDSDPPLLAYHTNCYIQSVCHGASVPDITTKGSEFESISSWRERVGINADAQIRLVKLSHMRYQHPDLDQITIFLKGS